MRLKQTKPPTDKKQTSTILLWLLPVYILSFACYLPMLLQSRGMAVWQPLYNLKYGFILIPPLITLLVLIRERRWREYLRQNFQRISLKEAALCLMTALLGIAFTCLCSFAKQNNYVTAAYASLPAFLFSSLYLYATAILEESAWRGFLFRRLAAGGKITQSALFCGVLWALWHIPMWRIRNSLSLAELLPLFLWAVLISVILGTFYHTYRNILSVSFLHMAFNVCFLAPTNNNNMFLLLCLIIYFIYKACKKAPQ